MDYLRKIPATLTLIIINCGVFAWMYFEVSTTEGPEWSFALLNNGALYNPYTLDGQWYRLITHMFLHGHLIHLALNMYGLFVIGMDIESNLGSKKFLLVYFIGGLAAAITSLYVNLFVSGVGASGAIFAVFGFALVYNIQRNREEQIPIAPLIINFVVYILISLVLAKTLHADSAAHIGGAFCGLLLGLIPVLQRKSFNNIGPELMLGPVVILLFFLLPKDQVRYYQFFQKVLQAQDSTNFVLNHSKGISDDEFLKRYRRANSQWDTAMIMLDAQPDVPAELQSDTFRLRRMIKYQKAEGNYRSIMVEKESYIYADSMDIAGDSIRKYSILDFVLITKYTPPDTTRKPPLPPLETAQIWYDSNWVEIPNPPASFYRIGQRDSAGLWQGPLADYFRSGNIQMKGTYKDDLKDGIFIFYSDDKKYLSAGVYNEDQRVGKWETFHPNGRIESEIYYRDRYFLKSYWDSTGTQMVFEGNGREIHRYPNGVVATEGEYIDGRQEGYWYGRRQSGEIYFEENYNRGRLINGRSKNTSGRIFVYDETTLYALPEGGFKKLNDYIQSMTKDSDEHGTVKLSFRVTVAGQLTDFKTEVSVSKELDQRARQIIMNGPRWLPARLHGIEPTDGYGLVSVVF